jgi:hypothetical protein
MLLLSFFIDVPFFTFPFFVSVFAPVFIFVRFVFVFCFLFF